jgi:hypothetical protein
MLDSFYNLPEEKIKKSPAFFTGDVHSYGLMLFFNVFHLFYPYRSR